MINKTNLEIEIVKIQEKQDWPTLCTLLEDNFKLNPDGTNSLNVELDIITILAKLLNETKKLLLNVDMNSYSVLKQIYKALRNSITYNSTAQMFVADNGVLEDTLECLKNLKSVKDENGIACLKMLLQFLINLSVNNTSTPKKIWGIFKDDLKEFIKDSVCFYHTSALIYNIFRKNGDLLEQDCDIINYILDSYKQNNENEYFTFLLELFIKNVNLNKNYVNFNPEQRILCLDTMKELLNKDVSLISEDLIVILSTQFKQKSDCILKTVTDYLKDVEPYEVTLLLELLATITSNEKYLIYLQGDKSLLINCAFLLKSIHSVGKETENNFTPIGKLSKLGSDIELLKHPAYGFKASIIRLLANLCWKHKCNQDQVRELDCIPLLLDCCNIDARNPFIIQWVVFAIRNLCEKNLENQKVIADMTKEGVVSSAALHEMGITLNSDDQQTLKIVPLHFNK